MATLTGKQIPIFRLVVIARALKFEIEHGTQIRLFRGPLPSTIVKREFGWKGDKVCLLAALVAEIERLEAEANAA